MDILLGVSRISFSRNYLRNYYINNLKKQFIMNVKSLFLLAFSALLIMSCSKEENEPNTSNSSGNTSNTEDSGEGEENGSEAGTFTAQVSGDFEHELTGIAWFEDDGDDQLISFWVDQSEWLSFAFQFNPPIEEKEYTAREVDPTVDRAEDEVDATTSNGNYMFFATDGELEITNVSNTQVDGEFNINYEYSDNDDDFTINITGSFSAEED